MSELLPCPFCGAEPHWIESDEMQVTCRLCGVTMPYMSLDDEATARWNTRSPVEDARGELVEAAAKIADGAAELARAASFTQEGWSKARDMALDIAENIRALSKSLPSPRGWQEARNEAFEAAAKLCDDWAEKSKRTARRLSKHPAQGLAEQDYDAMADECNIAANEAECLAEAIRALKSLPSLLESPLCE